jgi:hypothetical protein
VWCAHDVLVCVHAWEQGGTVPSGTSRYFSVNFGKVHLVALNL